jgi:cytochrome c oxidase subunit 2
VIAYLFQDPKNYIENPAPPAPIDTFRQLERLASTFHHVDGLFYFTYIVCIVSFVVIAGALGYSVIKYRRKTYDQPAASNVTHNTPLEVIWTVVPLIVVMVIFAWGWWGSLDMTVVPADARQYKAKAAQWSWEFQYPNDAVASYNELWLEVGKPAAFTLESSDVLHAFFVPSMRVKRDVVPGRFQTLWFQPTEMGDYHLFCAEYCGKDHSRMYSKVHVVSAATYASRPWDQWDDANPAKGGENLYKALCQSCHTLNGAPLAGPSWQGMFTKQPDGTFIGRSREVIVKGGGRQTITVDDAYIMESIKDPEAKKVAEAPFVNNNMTPFPNLEEKKVKGIIAFMKKLTEQGQ